MSSKKKTAPAFLQDTWIKNEQRDAKFGDTFRPLLLLGVATMCPYCNMVISNEYLLDGHDCPECKKRIKD